MTEILTSLSSQLSSADFWSALGSTVSGWLLGLTIAVIIGGVGGILIASFRILDRLLSSTVEFLRPIPSVALVPVAALLFGTSMEATLLLVVFASTWQVLVQVIYGVRDVDKVALETARTYRLGTVRTIRSVMLPSLMPYLIIGVRLAAAVALILQITGELIIGTPGLGRLISVAQSSAAVPTMYALVLVSAFLGVLINSGMRMAEGKVLFWHASIRGDQK
ncbi:ABC transporter permease [Nesterenkonia haasae]|uniref:ABC transporter permease n=1 Tax=Nesterenkonia haasae TaxID=2587813 RepID=UPI001F347386|nr:ABC transporter permease subunit [Nesterenkonia haasae]